LNNASSVTGNLKKNNDSITALISNANLLAKRFAKLPVEATLDSIEGALSELKQTLAKVKSPNGTIGALMNDRQVYNKLQSAIASAEYYWMMYACIRNAMLIFLFLERKIKRAR